MTKGDWWFKFEYSKWDDPELRSCTMETQGFWLRAYATMRKSGVCSIAGTVTDLVRMIGCTPEEAERSIAELKDKKVADVTQSNKNVTLTSRHLKKALKIKKQTRLRVRKHRGNDDVTPKKQDIVISKSKELEKEEEKNTEKKEQESVRVENIEEPEPIEVRISEFSLTDESFLNNLFDALRNFYGVAACLPDEVGWLAVADFADMNGYTVRQVIDCLNHLSNQKWRGGRVSARTVKDNLPEFIKKANEVQWI